MCLFYVFCMCHLLNNEQRSFFMSSIKRLVSCSHSSSSNARLHLRKEEQRKDEEGGENVEEDQSFLKTWSRSPPRHIIDVAVVVPPVSCPSSLAPWE